MGLLAFTVKLWLAATTVGTNDTLYYRYFAEIANRAGGPIELYRQVLIFNHPPFIIHYLSFVQWLEQSFGWSFPFSLRITPILADIGSAVIIWKLLRIERERENRGSSPGLH